MQRKVLTLLGGFGLVVGIAVTGTPRLFAQAQGTLPPKPFPAEISIQIPAEAYGVLGQHTFPDGVRCAYLVSPGGTQLTCDWAGSTPRVWTTHRDDDAQ